MSELSKLHLHSQFNLGPLDPRVFGGFIEHMGRCVYEGVYDPKDPGADPDGLRSDVAAALKRLKFKVMRYPGGNFASGYHWEDGIGPREKRPRLRELAWQSLESNAFGTEEAMKLMGKMGWTPMMAVNLGTGTAEEARNWVEYCNMPKGTKYADMRPSDEPHKVKLWCLGNEMDGPWQLGHVPARDYAIRAQQAAKLMKDCDPSIELVACGTCWTGLPTYLEWDREVLEYVGDSAQYISLHRYSGNWDNDTPNFLAEGLRVDKQIEEMDAVCRYVAAKKKLKSRHWLCFDEWNVWYKDRDTNGRGLEAPHLIEEVFNLEDALVVAQYLNSFLRHADVVKIANIAQIVNIIAPILTRRGQILIQSIFHPFAMLSSRGGGLSLRPSLEGPAYENKELGKVPYLDASALLDGDKLKVFVTNRDDKQPRKLEVAMADRKIASFLEGEVLTGPSAKAANSYEDQTIVAPRGLTGVDVRDGKATLSLPPLSAVAFTLALS